LSKKQWEEWKQDPKIKAYAEKKQKQGKARLDKKMKFTRSLQEYEKFGQMVHDHTYEKAWKEREEDEVFDSAIEYGYIRIVIVFVTVVSLITSGLLWLNQ